MVWIIQLNSGELLLHYQKHAETWNIGTFSISFTKSTMLVVAICGRGYNKSPLNVEFTDKNHAEFSINDEYGKPSIIYLSLGK